MNLDIMNLAWLEEIKNNPQTAYNSWCRGYEAGLAAACKETVLIEREAIIDIVARHGGSVEIEAAIRARSEK